MPKKRHNKCASCGRSGHNSRTCPNVVRYDIAESPPTVPSSTGTEDSATTESSFAVPPTPTPNLPFESLPSPSKFPINCDTKKRKRSKGKKHHCGNCGALGHKSSTCDQRSGSITTRSPDEIESSLSSTSNESSTQLSSTSKFHSISLKSSEKKLKKQKQQPESRDSTPKKSPVPTFHRTRSHSRLSNISSSSKESLEIEQTSTTIQDESQSSPHIMATRDLPLPQRSNVEIESSDASSVTSILSTSSQSKIYKCKLCKLPGHNIKTCPMRKIKKKCSCCGERGHNTSNCPKDSSDVSSISDNSILNSQHCKICKLPGHYEQMCPNKSKIKNSLKETCNSEQNKIVVERNSIASGTSPSTQLIQGQSSIPPQNMEITPIFLPPEIPMEIDQIPMPENVADERNRQTHLQKPSTQSGMAITEHENVNIVDSSPSFFTKMIDNFDYSLLPANVLQSDSSLEQPPNVSLASIPPQNIEITPILPPPEIPMEIESIPLSEYITGEQDRQPHLTSWSLSIKSQSPEMYVHNIDPDFLSHQKSLLTEQSYSIMTIMSPPRHDLATESSTPPEMTITEHENVNVIDSSPSSFFTQMIDNFDYSLLPANILLSGPSNEQPPNSSLPSQHVSPPAAAINISSDSILVPISDSPVNIKPEISSVRPKRTHRCSYCKKTGHNILSCSKKKIDEANAAVSAPDDLEGESSTEIPQLDRPKRHQKCALCKKESHNAATCPTRSSFLPDGSPNDEPVLPPVEETHVPAEEDIVQPNMDQNRSDACEACKRNRNLKLAPIILSPLGPFARRKFLRNLLSENSLVCCLCKQYLNRGAQRPNFDIAWPCIIYYFASDANLEVNGENLVKILPNAFREMWSMNIVRETFSEQLRGLWHTSISYVKNITTNYKKTRQYLDKNNITIGLLNTFLRTFPHPSIRCPMGCAEYIDAADLSSVSYKHILKSVIPSFHEFDADTTKLKGFRPDWTTRGQIAGDIYYCSPSVLIDENGFRLLTCGTNVHSNSSFEYIHVPTHPIYENDFPMERDDLAIVSVVPKFQRGPSIGKSNVCFAILDQHYNYSGASTFRITTDQRGFEPGNYDGDKNSAAKYLCFKSRPNILEAHRNNHNHQGLWKRYKKSYEKSGTTQEQIAEHKASGTFIPYEEAIKHQLFFRDHFINSPDDDDDDQPNADLVENNPVENLELQEGVQQHRLGPHLHDNEPGNIIQDQSEQNNANTLSKWLTKITHPNNKCGHKPYYVPYHLHASNKFLTMIIRTIIIALIHCPFVYHKLFLRVAKRSFNEQQQPIVTKLLDEVQNIKANSKQRGRLARLLDLEVELKRYFLNAEQQAMAMETERFAGLILGNMVQMPVIHLEGRLEGLMGFFNENPIFIVTTSHPSYSDAFLDTELGQHLLLAANSHYIDDEDTVLENFEYRWTTTNDWWFVDKRIMRYSGNYSRSLYCFNIYATEEARLGLKPDELVPFKNLNTSVMCSIHKVYLTVLQTDDKRIKCSTEGCTRLAKLKCPTPLRIIESGCLAAVCNTHKIEIEEDQDHDGFIDPPPDMMEQLLARPRSVPRTQPETTNPTMTIQNIEESSDEENDPETERIFEENFLIQEATLQNEPQQEYSSRIPPSSVSDASMEGSFLTNILNNSGKTVYSRSAPKRLISVLQHIRSSFKDSQYSLLYLEGILFPSIFYAEQNEAVVGALPLFLYGPLGEKSYPGGLASLVDHLQVRLRDPSIATSTHIPYVAWVFDVLLNKFLKFNSPFLALRRGLETINKSWIALDNGHRNFRFDETDSNRQVRILSYCQREKNWTYFITLTANQSMTPGLQELTEAVQIKYDPSQRKNHGISALDLRNDEHRNLQKLLPIFCRTWERVVRLFFHWVRHSKQRLLGHVFAQFYRYEFQSAGARGNLPHIHGGITLFPGESEEVSRARIVNQLEHFFGEGGSYECLQELGLIKSRDEFTKLHEATEKQQTHDCFSAQFRCHKITKEGRKICRWPKNRGWGRYGFEKFPENYDSEEWALLNQLRLAQGREVHPLLRAGKHFYPNEEGITTSPGMPIVNSTFRSNHNVQMVDSSMSMLYLSKYTVGAEGRLGTVITVTNEKGEHVNVDREEWHNEKLTSTKRGLESQREAKQLPKNPMFREVATTEMVWFNLNLPYVENSMNIVHASTHPKQARAAVKSGKKPKKLLDENNRLALVELRRQLPPERQFTAAQQVLMRDLVDSHYHADNTTKFSLRCPELLPIDTLEHYLKFFSLKPAKPPLTARENINECQWIDGSGSRARIRRYYVDSVRQYLRKRANDRENIHLMTHELLDLVESIYEATVEPNPGNNQLINTFVDWDDNEVTVVVFTNISMDNFEMFLIHYVLSMGRIQTELELFEGISYRDAFKTAKLLRQDAPPTVDDVIRLTRRYIIEQLIHVTLGKNRLLKLIKECYRKMSQFLLGNENEIIHHQAMPVVLERNLQDQQTEKLRQLEEKRRCELVSSIFNHISDTLPNRQSLINGEIQHFIPRIVPKPTVTPAAVAEQNKALEIATAAIDLVSNPLATSLISITLLGPPGTGKTYLLLLCAAYALTKGLRTQIVSLTSERARVIGGEHIHMFFAMPVEKGYHLDCLVSAEKCYYSLHLSPERYAAVKRLEVLIFEEIGTISSHTLCVIDYLLRKVKNNKLVFGGVMILASGDPRQLSPINGQPVWLTSYFVANFKILLLENLVRSAGDIDLQNLITIVRKPVITAQERRRVRHILSEKCKNQFHQTSEELPPGTIQVVSKKVAQNEIIEKYRRRNRYRSKEFLSKDEVESTFSVQNEASPAVTSTLDRHCKEPQTLSLFVGSVMRITYNNNLALPNLPVFSQGQLAVITKLPTDDEPFPRQRITVKLVPPGERCVNVDNLPEHWKMAILSRRNSEQVRLSDGRMATRHQWPLTYSVSSTIHKIIGDTLPTIAATISNEKKQHAIWERGMFLVILSRTQSLKNMYFLGSKQETLDAVNTLLMDDDMVGAYIESMMEKLNVMTDERVHDIPIRPPMLMRHIQTDIPDTQGGFVSLAISKKDCRTIVIEKCSSLKTYMAALNLSHKTDKEIIIKRPWLLLMYVCGFHGTPEPNSQNNHTRNLLKHRLINALEHSANILPRQFAENVVPDVVKRFVAHNETLQMNIKIMRCLSFDISLQESTIQPHALAAAAVPVRIETQN